MKGLKMNEDSKADDFLIEENAPTRIVTSNNSDQDINGVKHWPTKFKVTLLCQKFDGTVETTQNLLNNQSITGDSNEKSNLKEIPYNINGCDKASIPLKSISNDNNKAKQSNGNCDTSVSSDKSSQKNSFNSSSSNCPKASEHKVEKSYDCVKNIVASGAKKYTGKFFQNFETLQLDELRVIMSKFPWTPINLSFSNLTFCVRNENKKKGFKTILKGVSGDIYPGQLTAIMGPSGAGKSTLMNILAGYKTSKVSGDININGKERHIKSFRKKSCYIMQEDHLLPYLSIQESMEGAATLKLGDKVPLEEKKAVIAAILNNLSLSDSKQTRVSNLSGGEKKRLSIALELVNNPPVMFFDEPTSGLDSVNSYQCINLLKKLAEEGRTIVCTIHQPSARIFDKFDNLIALADGQCIYSGTIPGLVPFFSSLALECPPYHNLADFLVEVASGEYGNFVNKMVATVNVGTFNEPNNLSRSTQVGTVQQLDLVSRSRNSESKEKEATGDESRQQFLNSETDNFDTDFPASFLTQFLVLFRRTFLSIIRDKMLTKIRLAVHIIVGIFIGILYYKIGNEASKVTSNIGYMFFSMMFLLFTAMMPTILTFPLEMNVFIREHLNHWYSIKSYYLAKTMADIPFQIIYPIIYVGIVYFMTGQPYEASRFISFTFICILTSLVAQSMGLAIGAALELQQAVFFGPAVAIPCLLFSGFFVTFQTIPIYLRWLTYLTYVRYGYEGALVSTYGMNRPSLNCSEAFCIFKHPVKILEQFDVQNTSLWFDFLLLIIYFLVMRGLGYFILRSKIKKD